MEICDQLARFDKGPGLEQGESLHSAVASALQRACASIGYYGRVAFTVVSDEDAAEHHLHPEENRLLHPRAGVKRRSNWVRGRVAAHAALNQLGMDEKRPITRGAAGEPIWPEEITGSITHCNEYSIAAVIRSSDQLFLGIDLEDLRRIEALEIASVVCRPNELTWVRSSANACERLGSVFSAKEALYKALFRIYGRYIDFTEVELSHSPDESGFRAVMCTSEDGIHQGLPFISTQRYKNLIFSCSTYKA